MDNEHEIHRSDTSQIAYGTYDREMGNRTYKDGEKALAQNDTAGWNMDIGQYQYQESPEQPLTRQHLAYGND